MSRKKKYGGIPYAQPRANGLPGFRLQILDPQTGQRLKPREIDPTQPAFYADENELRAAYDHLHALLALRLERGATLRGFWQDWTDPDDWYWGTEGTGRKPQSLRTQRSHTRGFVESFDADMRIDAVTAQHVEDYMKTKPAASNIPVLDQMFRAAIERKLIAVNPFEVPGQRARKTAHAKREQRERLGDNETPSPEQIAELLEELGNPARYPHGFAAWMETAVATGMRSGELDGMWIDDLDLSDPSRPLYTINRQYHHQINQLTAPKYESVRTILLPQSLVPILERCIWDAKRRCCGSPFVFNNKRAQNWRNASRAYYWNDESAERGNLTHGRAGLRHIVGGKSMYCATRCYFATQAVLAAPAEIPRIAKHYGHKDNGRVLLAHYTRLTDTHGQEGMANVYAALLPHEPVRLADRRRAA